MDVTPPLSTAISTPSPTIPPSPDPVNSSTSTWDTNTPVSQPTSQTDPVTPPPATSNPFAQINQDTANPVTDTSFQPILPPPQTDNQNNVPTPIVEQAPLGETDQNNTPQTETDSTSSSTTPQEKSRHSVEEKITAGGSFQDIVIESDPYKRNLSDVAGDYFDILTIKTINPNVASSRLVVSMENYLASILNAEYGEGFDRWISEQIQHLAGKSAS